MEKHDPHDIRQDIKDLLDSQKLAVLSTQGEAGPYVSLVAFAAADDLKSILFATPVYTRKYDNLKRKPEVALLVDNRVNDADDFKRGKTISCCEIYPISSPSGGFCPFPHQRYVSYPGPSLLFG